MKFMLFSATLLISLLLNYSITNSFTFAKFTEYHSLADFLEKTDSGSIAFVGNYKNRKSILTAQQFKVFSIDEPIVYSLPKSTYYMFCINHRWQDIEDPFEVDMYIGIKVLLFYNDDIPDTFIELIRNAKWKRENTDIKFTKKICAEVLGTSRYIFPRFEGNKPTSKILYDFSWKLFSEVHKKSCLEYFDCITGFAWHGEPQYSDRNSWDERGIWRQLGKNRAKVKSVLGNFINPDDFTIKAQLRKFQATSDLDSSKPVAFRFNRGQAQAAYLEIFTPSLSDFKQRYILIFNDQSD